MCWEEAAGTQQHRLEKSGARTRAREVGGRTGFSSLPVSTAGPGQNTASETDGGDTGYAVLK